VFCEVILFFVLIAEISSPALGLTLRNVPFYGIAACAIGGFLLGLVAFIQTKKRNWVAFSLSSLLLPILLTVLFVLALGTGG